MKTIIRNVILTSLIMTVIIILGCKDDNIVNAYLNITKNSRAEEDILRSSKYFQINITVMDPERKVSDNAGVSMILPNGIILNKTTDYSGNAPFLIDKSLKGRIEVYAVSENNIFKGNIVVEISETINNNPVVYLRELSQ
ncbi:MAG: hypothetical protein IPL53_19020 [Ignavibacteria bacterium]|nr:hypothetical protein [Ignavibacteria bacterium]